MSEQSPMSVAQAREHVASKKNPLNRAANLVAERSRKWLELKHKDDRAELNDLERRRSELSPEEADRLRVLLSKEHYGSFANSRKETVGVKAATPLVGAIKSAAEAIARKTGGLEEPTRTALAQEIVDRTSEAYWYEKEQKLREKQ